MAKKGVSDQYSQILSDSILVSGAGVLVTEQIPSAYTAKDRMGIVIEKIEYDLEAVRNAMAAAGDNIQYGIMFSSAQPAGGMQLDDIGLIDFNSETYVYIATAAGTVVVYRTEDLKVKDYTMLKGGGLLAHPATLYNWSYVGAGAGLVAIRIPMRILYHTIQLSEDMYRELWEARIISQTI